MARAKGILRYLSLAWDRDAARRVEQEAEASLAKTGKEAAAEFEQAMAAGGKKASRALTTSLEREFRVRMGRARQALAEGAIDERAFQKEGREAAAAFDRGLAQGIKRIGATGSLTDVELSQLQGRFKAKAGGGVSASAGGLRGWIGGMGLGSLAGFLGTGVLVEQGRQAMEVTDRFEASQRKLEGTSRLTGQSLEFLTQTAKDAEEGFSLATPVANDFTAEVVKLTEKAGDVARTGDAMRAFLDLGAARGLTAADTLTAVGQAILGIDEGTDKLFGKNPSTLYEEYALRIGTTAEKLSDQQKAQALLDATLAAGERTRGAYTEYLKSNAGQAEQAANQTDQLRRRMGEALEPTRTLGRTLRDVLYANLLAVGTVLGKLIEWSGKVFRFTFEIARNPRDVWDRLWGSGGDRGPMLGNTTAETLASVAEQVTAGTAVDALGRPYKSPAEREREARDARERAAATAAAAAEEARKKAEQDAERKQREAQAAAKARQEARDRTIHEHQPRLADATDTRAPADQIVSRVTAVPVEVAKRTRDATNVALETLNAFEAEVYDLWQNVGQASSEAAYQMSSAFQDAFALMFEEGANLGEFFEALGRGMAGSMLAGLAQMAQGKAMEAAAHMIEAGAKALLFSDPKAAASIPLFAAEMAAWSALAGFAGAARGAVTGGRGAIPPSTRDVGLSTAERAERTPATVNIVLSGPGFHALNPEVQKVVHGSLGPAIETLGMPRVLQVQLERGQR